MYDLILAAAAVIWPEVNFTDGSGLKKSSSINPYLNKAYPDALLLIAAFISLFNSFAGIWVKLLSER